MALGSVVVEIVAAFKVLGVVVAGAVVVLLVALFRLLAVFVVSMRPKAPNLVSK